MARNPQLVKDKFFIIEHGEYVIIEHFNYEFIRNSLLKVYRHGSNERYMMTVVIKEKTLANDWEVRSLDLNQIYFSNERLRVQELMISDIRHENYRYNPNMPIPDVMRRWMEYDKNRDVQIDEELKLPVAKDIPEKVYTREELDEKDPRLETIQKMYPVLDKMVVLDWAVNYDAVLQDASKCTSSLSNEQLRINTVLHKCQQFMNTEISGKISKIMTDAFPDQRGFFSRLVGADVKYMVPDSMGVQNITNKLHEVLTVNTTQFRGAEVWFDELIECYQKHIEMLDGGIAACEFQMTQEPHEEMHKRHLDRVSKMRMTSNMSLMTVQTAQLRFNTEMEKLQEIRDVLVPIIINNLQVSTMGDVVSDEQTRDLITNLKGMQENINKSKKKNAEQDSLFEQ